MSATSKKSHSTAASATPRRSPRRLAYALLAVVGVVAAGVLIWQVMIGRGVEVQVRKGVALLERAGTVAETRAALAAWASDMRAALGARETQLLRLLCTEASLADPHRRLLLVYLTNADYGARVEAWQRWLATRERVADGQQPRPPRAERVNLEPRWEAPVGLTAWFSTIIPLEGQIYVASLGTAFDRDDDQADGVVRVDGRTGASAMLFVPPARDGSGPRDVVGLAAGDACLFVACYNGYVYCIDPDGGTVWRLHAGAPIVAPPLALDFNGDDRTDVVVVTEAGKAVAASGETGKTAWVHDVFEPAPAEDVLGATLAVGDVLGDGGLEIVVTVPSGVVDVLDARTGRTRSRHSLGLGTVAGVVCGNGAAHGVPAHVGDRAAGVWALTTGEDGVVPVLWSALGMRGGETLVAGLRALHREPNEPPVVLACPTGTYGDALGSVCALTATGLRWRWGAGGAIWGTPALADISGDRVPEVVVATIEPGRDGTVRGTVSVVSHEGHLLWRTALPAAIECSPVVADVDADHRLEVLVADQAGVLHCFGTGRYGPVLWGLAAGDSHNSRNAASAFSFGQAPARYQWQWSATYGVD